MDRASGRVGRRALRPAVHEFGSRSPGASLLTASVCTRGLRLTRRIVTRVCGPRLNFLRTAGACEGGAGRGEFILKHDRGSHSSRWLIPNCRRIFGDHAPHPTPENPHPTTAISWGPRVSHPTKSLISRGPRVSHPTKSLISRGPRVSHPTKSLISRGPRVSHPTKSLISRGPRVSH